MFKKINIKEIRESLALLVIAAIVGTIVSFVAQLFIISAKNIYDFVFNNENFLVTIDIGNLSLNLVPLLICVPSSLLVGLLMYKLKLPRWFGPADTIYAAHHKFNPIDRRVYLPLICLVDPKNDCHNREGKLNPTDLAFEDRVCRRLLHQPNVRFDGDFHGAEIAQILNQGVERA